MTSTTTCFVHRWSSFFSSLVIRNGSNTRRKPCCPTSVTALSFHGCTQPLACEEQPTSSDLQSGYLGRFFSPAFGTRKSEFSELLAHVSHSSRPRRSFRLCPTAGRRPPAVSQP